MKESGNKRKDNSTSKWDKIKKELIGRLLNQRYSESGHPQSSSLSLPNTIESSTIPRKALVDLVLIPKTQGIRKSTIVSAHLEIHVLLFVKIVKPQIITINHCKAERDLDHDDFF